MTFADALSHIEPEAHLHAHQGVECRLFHGEVLPRARLGARQQFTNTSLDLRDIAQLGRCQFHLGVLHEYSELGPGCGESRCKYTLIKVIKVAITCYSSLNH